MGSESDTGNSEYKDRNRNNIEKVIRHLMNHIQLVVTETGERIQTAEKKRKITLTDENGRNFPLQAGIEVRYNTPDQDDSLITVIFKIEGSQGDRIATYFFTLERKYGAPAGEYVTSPELRIRDDYNDIGVGTGIAQMGEEMRFFFARASADILGIQSLTTQIIDSTAEFHQVSKKKIGWTDRFARSRYLKEGYSISKSGYYYKTIPISPLERNRTIMRKHPGIISFVFNTIGINRR